MRLSGLPALWSSCLRLCALALAPAAEAQPEWCLGAPAALAASDLYAAARPEICWAESVNWWRRTRDSQHFDGTESASPCYQGIGRRRLGHDNSRMVASRRRKQWLLEQLQGMLIFSCRLSANAAHTVNSSCVIEQQTTLLGAQGHFPARWCSCRTQSSELDCQANYSPRGVPWNLPWHGTCCSQFLPHDAVTKKGVAAHRHAYTCQLGILGTFEKLGAL